MAPREKFKDVEINGRKWRIGRLDALTGSWVLYKILTQAMPLMLEAKMGLPLPEGRTSMSKEDFTEIQKSCLVACQELKILENAVIPMPVMLTTGNFGVDEIEDDTMLVLTLTAHVLIFNIASFFEESALKGLIQTFSDLPLFNAQT